MKIYFTIFTKIFHQKLNSLFIVLLSCTSLSTMAHTSEKSSVHNNRYIRTLIHQSPLGDHSIVYVYDFIVDFLLETKGDKSEAINIINTEKSNKSSGEIYKPYAASVSETQLSHIIQSLCKSDKQCAGVSLFDRGGFVQAIGIPDYENFHDEFYNLSINDELFNAFLNDSQGKPIEVKLTKKLTSIILPIYYDKENKSSAHVKESKESTIIGFIRVFRHTN